jgi:DNA adenine methylase
MHTLDKNRPFLKWPGNKFKCLQHIIPCLPPAPRLIEPFTGSGAIFLNSFYPSYVLGERNLHLVNLYKQLQHEKDNFVDYCSQWFQAKYNQKEQYYLLRKKFNESKNSRLKSSLFLYLNRHGYNGLCRFNLKGGYNVPFGSYIKPYFPAKEMQQFYQKSENCTFVCQDYQLSFAMSKAGDVIYCDPPYHPLSLTANFTLYTASPFNRDEQIKLARLAEQTAQKGVHVLISNHDTEFTRHQYAGAKEIFQFEVLRTINCQGSKRNKVHELLAYYHP